MTEKKLLNVYSFTISFTSAQGQDFSGSFTVHRPTLGEQMRIGVKAAQDLGGLANVDIVASMVAQMIATLEVVVDQHPEWWKPRELREMEVLRMVYDKYQDYLQEFQVKSSGRTPKSQGTGEGTGL
jgi:hypothetical protein